MRRGTSRASPSRACPNCFRAAGGQETAPRAGLASHGVEAQWRKVADQLRPKLPRLTGLLDEAETDVLAT